MSDVITKGWGGDTLAKMAAVTVGNSRGWSFDSGDQPIPSTMTGLQRSGLPRTFGAEGWTNSAAQITRNSEEFGMKRFQSLPKPGDAAKQRKEESEAFVTTMRKGLMTGLLPNMKKAGSIFVQGIKNSAENIEPLAKMWVKTRFMQDIVPEEQAKKEKLNIERAAETALGASESRLMSGVGANALQQQQREAERRAKAEAIRKQQLDEIKTATAESVEVQRENAVNAVQMTMVG